MSSRIWCGSPPLRPGLTPAAAVRQMPSSAVSTRCRLAQEREPPVARPTSEAGSGLRSSQPMRENAVLGRMPYGWAPIRIAGSAPRPLT